MFFLMYVLRIYELVDALSIRRYNTLLTSFATFVKKNLYKTIKLPGFTKNSYLKKRVYSVHFDTGRKLIRCRCRIRCWGQKQGNSCHLVLIRNHSILEGNFSGGASPDPPPSIGQWTRKSRFNRESFYRPIDNNCNLQSGWVVRCKA